MRRCPRRGPARHVRETRLYEPPTAARRSASAVAEEIGRQYKVRAIGRADGVVERYFAISGERRLKHPGVVAISAAARSELFA